MTKTRVEKKMVIGSHVLTISRYDDGMVFLYYGVELDDVKQFTSQHYSKCVGMFWKISSRLKRKNESEAAR